MKTRIYEKMLILSYVFLLTGLVAGSMIWTIIGTIGGFICLIRNLFNGDKNDKI